MVDAKKDRYGRTDAIGLLDGIRALFVAKGKRVTRLDLAKERPDDHELAALLLGPTGNLRAPTLRIGARLLVGFNAAMYEDALG